MSRKKKQEMNCNNEKVEGGETFNNTFFYLENYRNFDLITIIFQSVVYTEC